MDLPHVVLLLPNSHNETQNNRTTLRNRFQLEKDSFVDVRFDSGIPFRLRNQIITQAVQSSGCLGLRRDNQIAWHEESPPPPSAGLHYMEQGPMCPHADGGRGNRGVA